MSNSSKLLVNHIIDNINKQIPTVEKQVISKVIDLFFSELIYQVIHCGNMINFGSFGKFLRKETPAKIYHNALPTMKEPVSVPSRYKLKFIPGDLASKICINDIQKDRVIRVDTLISSSLTDTLGVETKPCFNSFSSMKATTKMVRNITNFCFTVPVRIIEYSEIKMPFAWQWDDLVEHGMLCLVPFRGTYIQARQRARVYGDIVFLQEMTRKGGRSSQFKVNIPKWILETTSLLERDTVNIEWQVENRFDVWGRIKLDCQDI